MLAGPFQTTSVFCLHRVECFQQRQLGAREKRILRRSVNKKWGRRTGSANQAGVTRQDRPRVRGKMVTSRGGGSTRVGYPSGLSLHVFRVSCCNGNNPTCDFVSEEYPPRCPYDSGGSLWSVQRLRTHGRDDCRVCLISLLFRVQTQQAAVLPQTMRVRSRVKE